jgi:HK97 family phage portal protein
MGILARLLGSRSLENPTTSLSEPDDWLYDALGSTPSSSGERVNGQSSLTYSPFWRGVNLISRDVAKLPLLPYKRVGEGKERATDHQLYPLLRHKPNREMTAFVFWQTLIGHALTEGNGLAYIFRRGDGTPEELIPLLPGSSYPVRVAGQLWYVTMVNGEQRKLRPENVFHLKGLSFDGLSGYSLHQKAKDSLGLGLALRTYASKFFRNNAQPALIIEHPKTLSPEAAKKLMAAWDRIHSGLDNAHRTGVLEEGAKAVALKSTARESQLTESRQFEIREVANWLGVPPHKLGDTTRTAFSSLEQENQSYLDDALDPWLVNAEQECREKLLSEEEKRTDTICIEFLRQALIRADVTARGQFYNTALQSGWMNRDEVRARENMNPLPNGEGQKYFIPMNMGETGGDKPAAGGKKKPPSDPPTPDSASSADDQEGDDAAADRAAMVGVSRGALVDVIRRMTKRLSVHARKSMRTSSLVEWNAEEHRGVLVEALWPVTACVAIATRRKLDASTIASQLIQEVRVAVGQVDAAAADAALELLPQQLVDRIVKGD